MFLKKIRNESGMIMMVAIAFILVMSILLAGVFSRYTSSALSLVEQSKRIRADQLTRGAYWVAYDQLRRAAPLTPPTPVTIDGTTYTIVFTRAGADVQVIVTY